MSMYASWTHGNGLTVESPENFGRVGHFGWGADMDITHGKASWMHIALPTPVIVADTRLELVRCFLMFRAENCFIRAVHVYDGSGKLQEFENLEYEGEHRLGLDNRNTFNLAQPHSVAWGIGISLNVVAAIGFDSQIPPSRFILASAGADYLS